MVIQITFINILFKFFKILKNSKKYKLNKRRQICIIKKCIKIALPIFTIIAIITGIIISRQKLLSANEIEKAKEENAKYTNEQEEQEWKIEIPEISLIAPIAEGTEEEILNEFVGHFFITPKEEGNVGLAAHNRGYPINYFENLKNLKGGEEIIYTYGKFTKTYVVIQNIKISDTDWSYLENSSENKITLITCIENEPEYRRCVQAIEKEE